jgi:hypothetical protein
MTPHKLIVDEMTVDEMPADKMTRAFEIGNEKHLA